MSNRHANGPQGSHSYHRSQASYNSSAPIPTSQANNGRERNGSMGNSQYNTGKSPPNLANKSMVSVVIRAQFKKANRVLRYETCSLQVLSSRIMSGWRYVGQYWKKEHDTNRIPAACPFSHTVDTTTHQAPCKYFMKVR